MYLRLRLRPMATAGSSSCRSGCSSGRGSSFFLFLRLGVVVGGVLVVVVSSVVLVEVLSSVVLVEVCSSVVLVEVGSSVVLVEDVSSELLDVHANSEVNLEVVS